MFKNVAAKFIVFAFDATTNVPKTGDAANITAYVSKDYGTVTVLGDTSATEMDATNAPGYYLFDAAQGETNADVLLVSGKSATANIKIIGAPATIYTRPTTGWLAPTVAARTLDVTATGEAGIDWSNVGAPTTAVDLSGTTIKTTQKVDVDTIKTNPVVNGGTITFPTTATLASTTNITAGTVTTATNVTNVNGIANNVITAASINSGAITSAKFAAGAIDAAAIAADAIGASELAADAVTEIQAGLATPTNITAGTITTVTNLTNAPTSGDLTATMKTSVTTAVPTTAQNATAVWATSMSDITGVPSMTGTVLAAINWLFALGRNKLTQTSTTMVLKKDDGSTTVASSTVSDDGTTYTRGEFS